MCINIDIVLHHATIKQYFDSFLARRETLGCVGQKCVRPPQFFLTGTPMPMIFNYMDLRHLLQVICTL